MYLIKQAEIGDLIILSNGVRLQLLEDNKGLYVTNLKTGERTSMSGCSLYDFNTSMVMEYKRKYFGIVDIIDMGLNK